MCSPAATNAQQINMPEDVFDNVSEPDDLMLTV
jgi:hypothetical protein